MNGQCSCLTGGKLHIYYQNVRGLRTKLSIFLSSVAVNDYHVIMLTETNLSKDVTDAELGLTGYSVFRADRTCETSSKGSMGGVLIAIHNTISCRLFPTTAPIEQVYVAVGSSRIRLVLGCLYLPPNSPVEDYQLVSETLDSISDEFSGAVLCVAGDFNLPMAAWSDEDICSVAVPRGDVYVPPRVTEIITAMSDMCAFHNFFQLNHISNINNVMLDLVLSNCKFNVIPCDPLLRVDVHHPPFCFELGTSDNTPEVSQQANSFYYDFKSADYRFINDYLGSFCWDDILSNMNIEDMINRFYEILYSTFDAFIPVKKVASRKFPRWFSGELIDLTIRKKIMHKKFKSSGFNHYYNLFSDLRRQCNVLSQECYKNYVRKTESSLQHNSKQFWNFINSKRKSNDLPNSVFLDDDIADMGPDAASLFAKFFSSVYVTESPEYTDIVSSNNINITNFSISISDIYSELGNLNVCKGPGPDNIHPIFLKHCAFALARPLHIVFNKSLRQGIFPSFWKTGFVVPIHKSGDRSNIRNFRPITILSIIPRVFESLVTKFLSSVLSPIINSEQFGFCSGKNAELNLLTYCHYISGALEVGAEVHSIYTDFSKAFDRVPHGVLLSKLETLGISGSLLDWIRSYLTSRTQMVRVNNFLSHEIPVPSGVPQGSHIGPLLFNLFINDVATCFVSSEFLLFADDLKLFRSVVNADDCLALQEDLNRFADWCRVNGMEVNTSKCKVMSFSRLRLPTTFNYTIDGKVLSLVSSIRDLGVILDGELSGVEHISNIVNKSLKLLGFIKRNTVEFSTVQSLKVLYSSLVRTHLEYCSSVWSPYYAYHINRIERVQKKFLQYINYKFCNNEEFHYEAFCQRFNLPPLSTRRAHHDLQLLFKLLSSTMDCPYLLAAIGLHAPVRNTRDHSTFSVPFHRTNYGAQAFIPRSVSLANRNDTLDFFSTHSRFSRQLRLTYN